MTAKELAEKIKLAVVFCDVTDPTVWVSVEPLLSAALEEAIAKTKQEALEYGLKEIMESNFKAGWDKKLNEALDKCEKEARAAAYEEGLKEQGTNLDACRKESYHRGLREAYEDAAKTMEEGARMYPGSKFFVSLFHSLAARFRAKAAEVGK